jgi:hypothetical protein
MSTSQRSFTGGALATRRWADLMLAWFDAAEEANEAYAAWRDDARDRCAEAFVVYRAALDREEAAAHALQLHAAARALHL